MRLDSTAYEHSAVALAFPIATSLAGMTNGFGGCLPVG